MRLPRSIDHRLKDAIVSFQFTPGVPPETVVGYIHSLLKEHLQVTLSGNPAFPELNQMPLIIESRSFYFITSDGNFRIDIESGTITFNLIRGYAGWAAYQQVVQTYLEPLFQHGVIQSVSRLGIRYITQFDQLHILDHVRAVARLDLTDAPTDVRTQVRFELIADDLQAMITLVDGYPAQPTRITPTDTSFFSLIDIDVIHYFETGQPNLSETVLPVLERAHQYEKTLFFGLLTPDFLETLNPVY